MFVSENGPKWISQRCEIIDKIRLSVSFVCIRINLLKIVFDPVTSLIHSVALISFDVVLFVFRLSESVFCWFQICKGGTHTFHFFVCKIFQLLYFDRDEDCVQRKFGSVWFNPILSILSWSATFPFTDTESIHRLNCLQYEFTLRNCVANNRYNWKIWIKKSTICTICARLEQNWTLLTEITSKMIARCIQYDRLSDAKEKVKQ